MTPTLLGLVFFALGLIILLSGSRQDMLAYVLGCSLFNGSASLVLTALGNTSVQPAVVATGLLALRCVLPDRRGTGLFAASLSANGWLLLFVGWCFAGAYSLPFLFSGELQVVPLRPTGSPTGLETHPLHFSPQNVTTSFYLLATLAAAVCAHVAASEAGATVRVARLASGVTLAHAAIGWFAMAVRDTPLVMVTGFLRNGIYMQLDQSFGGFARITGISPETSLYVSFGFAWFVFVAELWLRNVDRRWSGPASLAMLVTLVASTSSTAYVGLAGYGLLVIVRLVYFAGAVPARKALVLAGVALVFLAGGLALVAQSESFAAWLGRTLRLTTTDKLDSASGLARMFWARQGVEAFLASWGLGIGVGSFRSSSLFTAILGSGGAIAMLAFLLHLGRIFHPFERATWRASGEPMTDVAKAASWAALVMLVPAAVSAPSPDPGLLWGLIAGTALGLRRAAALVRQARAPQAGRGAIGSVSALSRRAPQGRRGYQGSAEAPTLILGDAG
ncbi:hypothetical protein ACFOD9_04450 [Novosphingobium bradum]|uniref:Uncharacterized protein n=1 Tax=Novosphingobium bradum TaxID=1737444 RepID=A0ABV7IRR0_9SPHN